MHDFILNSKDPKTSNTTLFLSSTYLHTSHHPNMGSSSSKAARAAGSAARQYPTRPPPTSQSTAPPGRPQPSAPSPGETTGPTVRPQPQATGARSDEINLDASDPDFARSLRSLGPVQPNPTMSPTSAFNPDDPASTSKKPVGPDPRNNPALAVLDARARLQDEAEREFMEAGKRGHEGRQFLDVYTLRQMLTMRDERGAGAGQIEKALGLRRGCVERLGERGVVGLVQEMGRAQKGVDVV